MLLIALLFFPFIIGASPPSYKGLVAAPIPPSGNEVMRLQTLSHRKILKLDVLVRPFVQYFSISGDADCIIAVATLILHSLYVKDSSHFKRALSLAYEDGDNLIFKSFLEQKITPREKLEITLLEFLLSQSYFGVIFNRNNKLVPLLGKIVDKVDELSQSHLPSKSARIQRLTKIIPTLMIIKDEFRDKVYQTIIKEILHSDITSLSRHLVSGEDQSILYSFYLKNSQVDWFGGCNIYMSELGYSKDELLMAQGLLFYMISSVNNSTNGYFSENPAHVETLRKLLDPTDKKDPFLMTLLGAIMEKGLFHAFSNGKFCKKLAKLAKLLNLFLLSRIPRHGFNPWDRFTEFLLSMPALNEIRDIERLGLILLRAFYSKVSSNYEQNSWIKSKDEDVLYIFNLSGVEKKFLEEWQMSFLGFKSKVFESPDSKFLEIFLSELAISGDETLCNITARSIVESHTTKQFVEIFVSNFQRINLHFSEEEKGTFAIITSCLEKSDSTYQFFYNFANSSLDSFFLGKVFKKLEKLMPLFYTPEEADRNLIFLRSLPYNLSPEIFSKIASIFEKAYFEWTTSFPDAEYITYQSRDVKEKCKSSLKSICKSYFLADNFDSARNANDFYLILIILQNANRTPINIK